MRARICRSYSFQSSHLLPGVPAGHKCGRLHGHTYQAEIEIEGEISTSGWVMDFADLDDLARPIVAELDHRHLNEIIPNPTAELIAAWILERVPSAVRVRVSENAKGWVEVWR